MEDHPTHPAVLATETVPVPLTTSAPLTAAPEAASSNGMGLVWKLVLLVAVVWLAKHWLFS